MIKDRSALPPLQDKQCVVCRASTPALSQAESQSLLSQLSPKWEINDECTVISRAFPFNNFYQTIAFTNAVAWVANEQDHHPDLKISYGLCQVSYTTHAISGLSENDFICAAKIDQLAGIEFL